MKYEDIIQSYASHLEHIQTVFSDFQALIAASESRDVQDFDAYEPEYITAPEIEHPFEKDDEDPELSTSEEDEPFHSDFPWNKYLACDEAVEEHAESFPPQLITDYSMVDPEHPAFARGVGLGIPSYVSVHSPHAGRLMIYPYRSDYGIL